MIEKVTMRFHRKLLNVEESGITFNSSEDMSGNMENSTLGPDLFNLHELKNGAILLYIIGKQKTNIYILIYSIREHSHMTPDVFWVFLTYLPTLIFTT